MQLSSNEATLTPALYAHNASRHRFLIPRHLKMIDELLLRTLSEPMRVIVEMPPRHGKSELVSKFYPAWLLGWRPDWRIILASYEATFAASWGGKARDVLSETGHWYPARVRVRDDSSARNTWRIEQHEGEMQTTGVGGPMTGKGAHVMIIDDPVKNAEEANSLTYRNRNWDWMLSTALTRLEPGGSVVLVQTRWHEDDLAGRLLAEQGDAKDGGLWTRLSLPAIAEAGDALGRAEGEALWPQRFSLARLEEIRASSAWVWDALYQQRPSPIEGGLIKWHQFKHTSVQEDASFYQLDDHRVLKSACERALLVDLAVSTKTSADYTVATTVARTPAGEMIVLDVQRVRLEGPDQAPLVKRAYARHLPAWIGVETTGYQLALVQQLRRDGLPVRELRPDKDKISRALSLATMYEAGRVYHAVGTPWLAELERELTIFPNGTHDDQVDTLAYAAQAFQRSNRSAWASAYADQLRSLDAEGVA